MFQESKVTGDSYFEYLQQQLAKEPHTPRSFRDENKVSAVLDFKKAYDFNLIFSLREFMQHKLILSLNLTTWQSKKLIRH